MRFNQMCKRKCIYFIFCLYVPVPGSCAPVTLVSDTHVLPFFGIFLKIFCEMRFIQKCKRKCIYVCAFARDSLKTCTRESPHDLHTFFDRQVSGGEATC